MSDSTPSSACLTCIDTLPTHRAPTGTDHHRSPPKSLKNFRGFKWFKQRSLATAELDQKPPRAAEVPEPPTPVLGNRPTHFHVTEKSKGRRKCLLGCTRPRDVWDATYGVFRGHSVPRQRPVGEAGPASAAQLPP